MSMKFYEMMNLTNIGEITKADLKTLSGLQLEAFSKLLGIPHSGKNPARIKRIYNALIVRLFLKDADDADYYAKKFSGGELRRQVKRVNGYAAPTKYGLAVVLLNWRNKCRQDGQKFLKTVKDETKLLPQKRLF